MVEESRVRLLAPFLRPNGTGGPERSQLELGMWRGQAVGRAGRGAWLFYGMRGGLAVTFGFELRFLTPAGRTIEGVGTDNDFPLKFSGINEEVSLRQLPRRPIDVPSSPERFLIKGSGFSKEDAARAFGDRLKLVLAVVGCETGMGTDVGRDHATSSWATSIQDAVREQQGRQLRDIVHGLDVFPEDPPITHLEISMTGTSTLSLNNFPEKIAQEATRIKPLPPKQSLALELYNLSHFEPDTKVRFLNLVTIIEVLADRGRKAKGIRDKIDELMRSVRTSELSCEEKDSLTSGLGNLKRESISAACRRMIAERRGEEAAQHIAACYEARSELLHDGKTSRPHVHDLGRLDEIVRHVLLAVIRAE